MKKRIVTCLLTGSLIGSTALMTLPVFAENDIQTTETTEEKLANISDSSEAPPLADISDPSEIPIEESSNKGASEDISENGKEPETITSSEKLEAPKEKGAAGSKEELGIPALSLRFISDTNKYQTKTDSISLAVDLKIGESEVVPAGTEINVKVPEDVWVESTIEEVDKPDYVDVSYSTSGGMRTIKITYKNEIAQVGSVGFVIKGRANKVGNYTVSASADYFGGALTIRNGSFEIVDNSAPVTWYKAYFESTGRKFSYQATRLSSIPNGAYTIGEFLNDGNNVPITTEMRLNLVNSVSHIYPGSLVWDEGVAEAKSGQSEAAYIFFKLNSGSKGFSFDTAKRQVTQVTGSFSDTTNNYEIVFNPGDNNEFYLTPRKAIIGNGSPTDGSNFNVAVHMPIIATDPSAEYDITQTTYFHSNVQTTNFSAAFRLIPETTGFVPRLFGPESTVDIDYGVTYDLLKLPNLRATDVEDGEISNKIKVADDDGFDTKKPGEYYITYEITDSDKNVVQNTFKVRVKENPNPMGGAVTVRYVNEDGEALHDPIILTGIAGDSYQSEELKFDGYTLKTKPANADGIFTAAEQEVLYMYEGSLTFVSAPTGIGFGLHSIPSSDQTYGVRLKNGQIVIRDTRKLGSSWQLSAKVLEELTLKNSERVIRNGLIYKNGATINYLSTTENTPIEEHTTTSHVNYTVDDQWSDSDGLLLSTKAGNILQGEYTGEIEWTLIDAP